MQTLDWNPPQKLVVANLTGRSLKGLSRKASQEIEWWVQLPHPTQSRHQQRHTRADAKAQLTRPLLVNTTGKVFVVVWVVVEWCKDNGLGEWAEPGEWQMARSCFARSSSWRSGSPIASTRSRELKVFPGNKKSLRRFEFRSWRCRHVIQTGDTFSEAVWSHIYFTRHSNRQRWNGTLHMRSKSGLVWSAHHMGHALDAAAHESGVRSRVDHQQSSSPQFFSQPIGWRCLNFPFSILLNHHCSVQ